MSAPNKKSPKSKSKGDKSKPKQFKLNDLTATKKRKRPVLGVTDEKGRDEMDLEKMLFGDSALVSDFGGELAKAKDLENNESALQKLEKTIYEDHGVADKKSNKKAKRAEEPATSKVDGPAWADPDDEGAIIDVTKQKRTKKLRNDLAEKKVTGKEYQERLRAQHAKLASQNLGWANLDTIAQKKKKDERKKEKGLASDEEDVESEGENDAAVGAQEMLDEALRSTAPLLQKRDRGALEPGVISIARMKDANADEKSKAVIQATEFHSNGQILLTAGLDKSLRLFEVDGRGNPHLQTIFLDDFPIYCAAFSADGKEVIMAGPTQHFYVYDIGSGRVDRVSTLWSQSVRKLKFLMISPDNRYITFLGDQGTILMISNKTKQWVATLKMNCRARAACYSPSGDKLYTMGANGEVFVWDVEERRCIRKFRDEGCTKATCIAVSQDGTWLAIGQDSGIVNIYRTSDESFQTPNPKPAKTLSNLLTAIAGLRFNHDGQLLAVWTQETGNGLRLVHMNSLTVFSNWPKQDTPLARVTSVSFSPDSGFMVVGNVHGKALLFKLHHFYASSS